MNYEILKGSPFTFFGEWSGTLTLDRDITDATLLNLLESVMIESLNDKFLCADVLFILYGAKHRYFSFKNSYISSDNSQFFIDNNNAAINYIECFYRTADGERKILSNKSGVSIVIRIRIYEFDPDCLRYL